MKQNTKFSCYKMVKLRSMVIEEVFKITITRHIIKCKNKQSSSTKFKYFEICKLSN